MDAQLLDHLEKLASSGKRLNPTEVWILDKCLEKHRSISDLSKLRGCSYQAIHKSVKKLESYQLLTESFKYGKETFYKCRVDIKETLDTSYKLRWRKEVLSLEEFIGVLASNLDPVAQEEMLIARAIAFIFDRSQRKWKEKSFAKNPTGAEIRSLLITISDNLLEVSNVVRQLSELPLFETGPVHEWMGEFKDEENTKRLAAEFAATWNSEYSIRGLINHPKLKEIAAQQITETSYDESGMTLKQNNTRGKTRRCQIHHESSGELYQCKFELNHPETDSERDHVMAEVEEIEEFM